MRPCNSSTNGAGGDLPLPLFRRYPRLAGQLPWTPLSDQPTPVEESASLGATLGVGRLYLKRDDLSGRLYGGNKVRKLEFLLADALRRNAREVVTFGFAGSNHALATAVYARQKGLRCTALLLPQLNAAYVRRNLLAGLGVGAEIIGASNQGRLGIQLVRVLLRGLLRHGRLPHLIPAGGSCPLGLAGYVNAAFELQEQVRAGLLPEPDLLYVAFGSSGTALGLMIGLAAAGMRTRVVPVRVVEERISGLDTAGVLHGDTVRFLHGMDPHFPELPPAADLASLRNNFLGAGYASHTVEAERAADLMAGHTGILLNGAYTARAFAALVADAATGSLKDKTVLFWNTFNSRDLASLAQGACAAQLPKAFRHYFNEATNSPPARAIRYW